MKLGIQEWGKCLGLSPEALSISWCYIPTYYKCVWLHKVNYTIIPALKFKYRIKDESLFTPWIVSINNSIMYPYIFNKKWDCAIHTFLRCFLKSATVRIFFCIRVQFYLICRTTKYMVGLYHNLTNFPVSIDG